MTQTYKQTKKIHHRKKYAAVFAEQAIVALEIIVDICMKVTKVIQLLCIAKYIRKVIPT